MIDNKEIPKSDLEKSNEELLIHVLTPEKDDDDYKEIIEKKREVIESFLPIEEKISNYKSKFSKVFILKINTDVLPVVIKNSNEPNREILFSRKVSCSATLAPILNTEQTELPSKTFERKNSIIKHWENLVLTENGYFPIEKYVELSKKCLGLIYAAELLDKYYTEIKELIDNATLFIHFDFKIINTDINNKIESFLVKDIFNVFKRNLIVINELIKESKWIIIGSYNNYIDDDSLLTDIDKQFKDQNETLKTHFHTDHLFLNNAEFSWQKKNIEIWKSIRRVFLPENSSVTNADKYFYHRGIDESEFYRYEIINHSDFNLEDIIALADDIYRIINELSNQYK